MERTKEDFGEELNVAYVVRNLGDFYATTSQFEKAEKEYIRSIEIVRKETGDDSSLLFSFRNYLAHFYFDNITEKQFEEKGLQIMAQLKKMG